ncbi:MAG: hypothetical protein JWN98_369 [Abditibacteriota bacterium]|nr:hypothetical protein [Abditibacteriota bacterium]
MLPKKPKSWKYKNSGLNKESRKSESAETLNAQEFLEEHLRLHKHDVKMGWLAVSTAFMMGLAAPLHAAEWKTLTPKGGDFSATLPGTPKLEKTVDKDKDGDVTTNHDWSLEAENAYYMVSFQEHPAATARLINPEGMLDESVKGITEGDKKAKITSIKKFKVNGFPGREVKATLADGVQLQAKVFWVKRRLYMAMAGFPTANAAAAKDAAKFLTSFKLLAKP